MNPFKNLLNNQFAKNIVLVSGGTIFAQGLSMLLSPVITRLYLPEEYGVLTIYIAILGMISTTGSLKYELAIPIADDEESAINIFALSISILAVVSLTVAFALFIAGNQLLSIFDADNLLNYIYWIPIGLFFAGLYNIGMQWAFREKNFRSISTTKLTQSIAQNITKILLGLLSVGPVGLIVGSIMGQSMGTSTLLTPLFRGKSLLLKINCENIFKNAKRYIKFPLLSAPSQFLNTLGIQLPILFITQVYGKEVVGLFGLANSIVNLPMNLIGRSVADVFYSELANVGRKDPKRIKILSKKLLSKMILYGFPPFLILSIFGPSIFSFVFGEAWYDAGVYAQLISLLVFARLIFTPISNVFIVYEKQKIALYLDVLRVIMVGSVFLISSKMNLSSFVAVGFYSITMVFIYLITFMLAQRTINENIY